MSSDIQALRSYLVELGFNVNNAQFTQFNQALEAAKKQTKGSVASIATDIIKWQATLAGFFLSTAAGIVTLMDKVSQADLKFKLMGERMMMTTQRARSFEMAKNALGGNLGAIAFDPELHGRFNTLMSDQAQMSAGLGGDFESNTRKIRDVRFEFTRLQFELQYGVMGIVNELFKALGFGSGDFVLMLRRINDYIRDHLPEWSRMIAKYLTPFLKDAWMIAKDLWEIIKELATAFDNFIGIISGDETLTGAANMEKFAASVQKLTHWIALALHYSLKLFGLFAGASAGGAIGAAIGSVVPGVGAVTGGLVGTLIGGTVGNVVQTIGHLINRSGGDSSGSVSGSTMVASLRAKAVADMIASQTGIDPAILYAQFAHETGNFTNRGAQSLHNFAGINVPGGNGTDYRNFSSDAEFANYYVGLMKGRYRGTLGAQSPEAFAAALKAKGYYGDSLRNYSNGLSRHMGDYWRGDTTNHVTVNVKTNANPQEIANAVSQKLSQQQQADRQRVLVQLQPSFG